jgi:hypothetical protein
VFTKQRLGVAILRAGVLAGVTIAACSDEPQFAAVDFSSHLSIAVAPDSIDATWKLVRPDGTEVDGRGDALIPDAEDGHYWLLWEPVPGWDPPAENPVLFSRGTESDRGIEGQYRLISEETGSLYIEAGKPGAGEIWNLEGPDGFFAAGRGSRTLSGRRVGDYQLYWESDPAEGLGNEEANLLQADGTLVLRTTVGELSTETGTIAVEPKPSWLDAPWVLESRGGLRLAAEGYMVLTGLEPDLWTLTWGDVEGYQTPSAGQVLLAGGANIRWPGTYLPESGAASTIVVDPEPAWIMAPWALTSPSGELIEGEGYALLEDQEPGIWSITWGDVEHYGTPTSSQVMLGAGTTLHWTAEYSRIGGSGAFIVDLEPDAANAPWILESDEGARLTGTGDAWINEVAPGLWTLTWQPVDGYLTPQALQTVLTAERMIRWYGEYVPSDAATGLIVIDPNPDAVDAPWQMVSEYGAVFTGRGDSTLADMPAGDYTLTWGPVPGHHTPTPNPVRQTLAPGGVAAYSLLN